MPLITHVLLAVHKFEANLNMKGVKVFFTHPVVCAGLTLLKVLLFWLIVILIRMHYFVSQLLVFTLRPKTIDCQLDYFVLSTSTEIMSFFIAISGWG